MALKLSSLSRGYGTLDGTVLIESGTPSVDGQDVQAEFQGNNHLKLPEISVKRIVPQSLRRTQDKYVSSAAAHPDLPKPFPPHNGIDVPKTFSTRRGALILFSDDAYPKKRKVKRERLAVPPDFHNLIEPDQLDKIPLHEFKQILLDLEETIKNNHFLANVSSSGVDESFIDVRPGFSPCRYMASMATFWDPEILERLLSEHKLHSATLRKYLTHGHKLRRIEKEMRAGLFNRRPRTYSYLSLPELESSRYFNGDTESIKAVSNPKLPEIHSKKRVKKDAEPRPEESSAKQLAVRPRVFQMTLPSTLADSEPVAAESDSLEDLPIAMAPYQKMAISSPESSDAPSETESFIALKTRMGQLYNGGKGRAQLPKLHESAFPNQVGLMNVILLNEAEGKPGVKTVRWEHQLPDSDFQSNHPINEKGLTAGSEEMNLNVDSSLTRRVAHVIEAGDSKLKRKFTEVDPSACDDPEILSKVEQTDHNASRFPSIAVRGKSHVQSLSHSANSKISSVSRGFTMCELPALNHVIGVEDGGGQRKGKGGQIKLPPIFMRQAKGDKPFEGDERTSDSLGLDVEGHGIDLGDIQIDISRKPNQIEEPLLPMNIGTDMYYADSSGDENSDYDGEWAGRNFRIVGESNAELSRKEILAKHSGISSAKGGESECSPPNRSTPVVQHSSARSSQAARAEKDDLLSESLLPGQRPQQDDVEISDSQTEDMIADNNAEKQDAQSSEELTELPPVLSAAYSKGIVSEEGNSQPKGAKTPPGSESSLTEKKGTTGNQQSECDMRDVEPSSADGPPQDLSRFHSSDSSTVRNTIDALREISDASVPPKEALPTVSRHESHIKGEDSSSSLTSPRKMASQTDSNLPEPPVSQNRDAHGENTKRGTKPISRNNSLDLPVKEPPLAKRSSSQADFESALDAIVHEVQEIAEPIKGSRGTGKTEKGKKRLKKQGKKKVKATLTPLFQVRRAEEDKPPAGLVTEPAVQINNDQRPKPIMVKSTKDDPQKPKQNREKRRRKKQPKVSVLDDFRSIMKAGQDNKKSEIFEDVTIPEKANKPDGELGIDVPATSEKVDNQTETMRNVESNVSPTCLPSITDHKEKITAPLPTEIELDSDHHSFGMSDDSGKDDGQSGKNSKFSDAKSQRRKLAAEKRRLEVERRRLEKQHEKERLAEEAAREERLKQEAEEEKQRRIKEYKRKKEEEELDVKRRDEEEAEARRRMESRIERERRQKEEERKKMERMLADLRLEEEMRKERARIAQEVEEEMKRKEAEMLAKLAENERQAYLERQRQDAEERRRLEEEKKREEEEKLELERLKEIEKQRELEETQERLRQRHQYLEQLKAYSVALGFELKLTRAFTYSYFRALPGFAFQSAFAVNKDVAGLPPIYESPVEEDKL